MEKTQTAGSSSKTALLTGGSSGIGLELSKLFARDGFRVLLVSKPETELKAAVNLLAGLFPDAEMLSLSADLSRPEAPETVYRFSKEKGIEVDVLVNCAGFGTFGFIGETDIDRELAMINLHIRSLYHLTRLYLRDMIDRNRGRIINLSSISAFQPNPRLATYGATKSFVLQFSRAVNFELKEKGLDVRVTAVCPTATRGTAFQSAAGMEKANTFDSWMTVTPDIVARDAYRGMLQGKDLVVPGRGFGLLRSLFRTCPRRH